MWYELWDSETGNRVGTYPTEPAALAAVAEDVGRYGRDAEAVVTLALLRRAPDVLVAEGFALVERALAVGTDHDRNGGPPEPGVALVKSALGSKATPRPPESNPPAR